MKSALLMDANCLNNATHSADVRIQLRLNGHLLPVAQLGPDFLVLKYPIDHPPDDAEIDMSIDGQQSRWAIHLIDGLAVKIRKARITRRHETNGTASHSAG
jgi:hypothetical protein